MVDKKKSQRSTSTKVSERPPGKSATKSKSKPPAKPSIFPQKKHGPNAKRPRYDELDIQLTDKELGEVTTIKRKLAEIREYKKLLAEDGAKPDMDDKERESQLIVRLLRIEKNAKMAARQRAKAAKTQAFRDAEEKAKFEKEKKNAKRNKSEHD